MAGLRLALSINVGLRSVKCLLSKDKALTFAISLFRNYRTDMFWCAEEDKSRKSPWSSPLPGEVRHGWLPAAAARIWGLLSSTTPTLQYGQGMSQHPPGSGHIRQYQESPDVPSLSPDAIWWQRGSCHQRALGAHGTSPKHLAWHTPWKCKPLIFWGKTKSHITAWLDCSACVGYEG